MYVYVCMCVYERERQAGGGDSGSVNSICKGLEAGRNMECASLM